MTFFNPTEPILRRKQHALDYQDRQGLLHFHLQIQDKTLFSNIYTRIDQVFVVWGLISAAIFITAQFAPISWMTQAIIWSVLTILGTVGTIVLTHFWVRVERLTWVLYTWVILMLGGVAITDLGIFLGWGQVLIHLSHLWLGLSGIGYLITGAGMRSRAFIISGMIHLFGIAFLPYVGGWQFLCTGLIMVFNLLVFAETQWDMRLPIKNYSMLSEEQRQFNLEQYRVRQAT
jgi:drug/metabolite transporter (DMT)-like permease